MLVKNHQKDIRSLSNYRPISLANVSYKIFASMLQSRLEIHVDSRIRDTQYGFRKNRSTTQPIHVMRRLIEIFERQNTPFYALFWIGVRLLTQLRLQLYKPRWNLQAFPPILAGLLWGSTIIRPSWSETPPRNLLNKHKPKDSDKAAL